MRQMDTILVAVGVPTREEAGATSGKLQLVHLSQEKTGTPESAGQSRVKGESSMDISNNDTSDTTEANVYEYKTQTGDRERCERKDSENGWDIPDISDLLDSISECDGVLDPCQGNPHLSCALGVQDHVEPSQDQGKIDREGESETDCEHTSWDWDDTNWTTECTNTTYQPHTEAQEQLVDGKPAGSEPRAMKSWHFLNSQLPKCGSGLDGKPHSQKLLRFAFAATKINGWAYGFCATNKQYLNVACESHKTFSRIRVTI